MGDCVSGSHVAAVARRRAVLARTPHALASVATGSYMLLTSKSFVSGANFPRKQ